MTEILLLTGNAHKLSEWQRIMAGRVTLSSLDLDLEEIQSDDPEKILVDKAKRAFDEVKRPVVVEDVSAGLVELEGLPGPFIKFFNKRLGQDALYKLANRRDGAEAVVSCSAAYYDGTTLLSVRGDVNGTVVSPRGNSTFGFDVVFVPDGYTQTYAEMDPTQKDAISHRSIAATKLLNALQENGLA